MGQKGPEWGEPVQGRGVGRTEKLRGSRQGHAGEEAVLGCQGMRNDREEREVTFQ